MAAASVGQRLFPIGNIEWTGTRTSWKRHYTYGIGEKPIPPLVGRADVSSFAELHEKSEMTLSDRPTYLYLAKFHDPHGQETFYKIGITQDLRLRFSNNIVQLAPGSTPTALYNLQVALLKQMNLAPHPYKHEYLSTKAFTLKSNAEAHEQALLDLVKDISYRPSKPMSGKTECFQCYGSEQEIDEIISAIISYIDGLPDGPP